MKTGLSKLDNNIPIKAIPKETLNKVIIEQFIVWLSDLLSLTDEVSAKRLFLCLEPLKELCWSMSLAEMKKMFEMYADGKLDLEPIPNYFDRILLGKIFNSYKEHLRANDTKPKKTEEQLKEEFDDIQTIICFDQWKHDGKVADEFVWVYAYLEKKKLIDYSSKEKKTKHAICVERFGQGSATDKAKIMLIEDYFARINAKDKHIKEFL